MSPRFVTSMRASSSNRRGFTVGWSASPSRASDPRLDAPSYSQMATALPQHPRSSAPPPPHPARASLHPTKDQLGLVDQRAAHQQPGAVARRQRVGRTIELVFESELLRQRFDAPLQPGAVEAVERPKEAQVLARGQPQQQAALVSRAQTQPGARLQSLGWCLTQDPNRSSVGCEQAGQQPEQGALPRTVGPQGVRCARRRQPPGSSHRARASSGPDGGRPETPCVRWSARRPPALGATSGPRPCSGRSSRTDPWRRRDRRAHCPAAES